MTCAGTRKTPAQVSPLAGVFFAGLRCVRDNSTVAGVLQLGKGGTLQPNTLERGPMQKIGKLLLHIDTNISRYATLATAVLTPLAALLGAVAAQLGGIDTSTGRALLAAASGIGTAVAGITWIINRGKWERTVGGKLADGKTGLFELIGIAKTTLDEVQKATEELPAVIHRTVAPPAPAPAGVAVKPHKPIAAPPTIPPVTPPPPQPQPTHPPAKTNPVKQIVGSVGGLLGKLIPKGK